MSKELTEKFQDGSFKYGIYYCKTKEDRIKRLELYHDGCGHGYAKTFGCNDDYPYEDIEEVLAPVPDYIDYKRLMNDSIELDKAKIKIYELVSKNEQLEKKLAIAKKALEDIRVRSQRDWDEYDCCVCATNAKTDIEEAK